MRASVDRRAGQTALSSILIIWLALAGGAQAAPLTLAEAQRLAVERDAGREALQSESDAMRQMAVAAGQLPDPEARIGAVNVPVDSWDLDREEMTMLEVGVMQRFPAGRTREHARARYESDALGAEAEAVERARRVRFEVERTWRELDYLDRALALAAEEARWITTLAGGAEAAYAAGEGESLALLDARLMAIEVEERRLGMQRERDEMLAELARWVGDEARSEREAAAADSGRLEPIETLVGRLETNPMLQSLGHMHVAALRQADVAREMYKPTFGFDVAYGFRDGSGMDGESRSDMLTAMLTFDIPLFTRNRQDREVDAARSRARAADSRRADMSREFEARLRAAHARAGRLAEILSLYETESTRLTGVSVEAALATYRSGDGSLDEVIAMQRRVIELGEREARARAEYALARAEIEYLAGVQP